MTLLLTCLLLDALRAVAQDEVQAAPIPPDAAVKKKAVKPLTVTYYNFQKVRPIGTAGIDSLKIARTFVKSHKADATLVVPSGIVDCPAGSDGVMTPGGKPLGAFLLGAVEMEKRIAAEKDGKAVPAAMKVPMSTRNIYVFNGFIHVEKAGTYDFRVPCDDQYELTIGGVVVGSGGVGGLYAANNKMYHSRAEFVEPGIYPVSILHYDKAKHAGIVVYSTVEPKGSVRKITDTLKFNLLQFLTEPPKKVAAAPTKPKPKVQPLRVWTSTQGRTLKARLISRDGNTLVLERENGKRVNVRLQQLAKKDQDYLKTLNK
jgi:hypothetical protein